MATAALTPDAYVKALTGWRAALVKKLRAAVKSAGACDESIYWGHLLYSSGGPALFIRTDADRVYFGFWRGQRMLDLEPRLVANGGYYMATLELREGTPLSAAKAKTLAAKALEMNRRLGDPRKDEKPVKAKPAAKKKAAARKKVATKKAAATKVARARVRKAR